MPRSKKRPKDNTLGTSSQRSPDSVKREIKGSSTDSTTPWYKDWKWYGAVALGVVIGIAGGAAYESTQTY